MAAMQLMQPSTVHDDDDDDTIPKRSPVIIPMGKRSGPSFITNRDYVPSVMVLVVFALAVYGVRWLTSVCPNVGVVAAVITLVLMAEWERRARYTLGRVRQRAHFDPLNLVRLPTPMIPPNIEMEPPTPFIPPHAELTRTDPEDILKRAQDTIGGSQPSETGVRASSMELAVINLLQEAAEAKRKNSGQNVQTDASKSVAVDKGAQAKPGEFHDEQPTPM